jgi:hypothetical protein
MKRDPAAVERAAAEIYRWINKNMSGLTMRPWQELSPHGQQFWLDLAEAALRAAERGKVVRIPFLGRTGKRDQDG